ncbi:MAG TPA: sensor histidine kinase [Candidatus Didemnitutus sp.]|nr:sensor histidine kinase [Candidatus Didemnitutus sp.]
MGIALAPDIARVRIAPESLAATLPPVVRSRVDLTTATTPAVLERNKERLYVLLQTMGWGAFLVLQFAFTAAFSDSVAHPGRDSLTDGASIVMVILMGLLLTHYARRLVQKWGWKQLGWKALAPRIVSFGILLSVLWSVAGYGYSYLIVGLPWPAKYSPFLILALSIVNGSGLMVVWLSFYFFYHTYERVNRLQVEQLLLVANVKEAELRALKSQLNPHFLFNSLNSLRALIDEDAPRAREAVTRLANMLRYSLQSGQLETVPFDDELRIVQDYLALEQIRHENRLKVRWEIGPEVPTAGVVVPPMLLQTLVENAVKYGIGTRREGGELVIAAHIENGVLHLRVTNPGDLTTPASPSAARAGSSTGVGLRNASERLKLLFGDRAALTLVAEPVGCVSADVLIPCSAT